jgi:hypothetical protein
MLSTVDLPVKNTPNRSSWPPLRSVRVFDGDSDVMRRAVVRSPSVKVITGVVEG